jgi:hypothetical protein
MNPPDHPVGGESTVSAPGFRVVNVSFVLLGSLLFVNGVGIGMATAFVPFAVNTLLVMTLSTGLFAIGVVWIIRSTDRGPIVEIETRRQSRQETIKHGRLSNVPRSRIGDRKGR